MRTTLERYHSLCSGRPTLLQMSRHLSNGRTVLQFFKFRKPVTFQLLHRQQKKGRYQFHPYLWMIWQINGAKVTLIGSAAFLFTGNNDKMAGLRTENWTRVTFFFLSNLGKWGKRDIENKSREREWFSQVVWPRAETICQKKSSCHQRE